MTATADRTAEELLTAYLREWPTLTIEEARRELGLDDDAEDAGGAVGA